MRVSAKPLITGPTLVFKIAYALVLCGILILGLWPFHRPRNAVTWIAHGLEFGDYGTIQSPGPFQLAGSAAHASSSFEIWFEPLYTNDSNTILGFSTPENPLQFTLHQYGSSLIVRRDFGNGRFHAIGIDHVFHEGRPVFITITSGIDGSTAYVDGVQAMQFPDFRLNDAFTAQLEIGTSPVVSDAWQGVLRGFALYGCKLRPGEVHRHYETWTTTGQPEFSSGEYAIAVYRFNEHAGKIVHNAVRGGNDLLIPERYSLLHQIRFELFWKEYRPLREHWLDILLNIVAFIPLGLTFCPAWGARWSVGRAIVIATCLGLATSFTIEFFQSFLPRRNSGTTDLITNTFGTCLGATLFYTNPVRRLLVKLTRRFEVGQ